MSTLVNRTDHPLPSAKSRWSSTLAISVYFALASLLIHFLTNGRYGYFRDELYFLALGDHLDWGYVDCAPFIGVMAKLSRVLFGDSLHALRFFPAVAGALTILLTGLIVRELGGKRFATALACLCVLVAPIYLALGTLLTMNVFEPLFWMGSAYVLIRVFKRDNPRLLLWFGLLAGLGIENKHSILFFGAAVVVGLLLTPDRRLFSNRWIWIAGAIALALFLPNVIWQVQHHYPTLEDLENVKRMHKNVELPPLAFLGQQILMLLPPSVIVWLAGLWYFFFDSNGKRYRALGWSFVVLFTSMMALKGKDYYLAPVYPMLFAAGGVFWEKLLANRARLAWVKVALPLVLLLLGAVVAPMAMPLLPVETLIRYQNALGFRPPKSEVGHVGPLQQIFGDMFGWPEMVETVAKVYNNLPPEERAKAAIFANNYGEAGAIDFFGPRYGLPKAICAHQNYFFWGRRNYTGEVLITLQWSRRRAEERCKSVEEVGTVGHPYAMGEEHYTIFVCRETKLPLQEVWPRLKFFN